eukprot:jgi/Tetstr1/462379/TSEL_007385.t1
MVCSGAGSATVQTQGAAGRPPVRCAAPGRGRHSHCFGAPPPAGARAGPSSGRGVAAEPGRSERRPKDPRQYGGDMDAMREAMHKEAAGRPGFIAGLLNGISGSAFGAPQAPTAAGGLASALGATYRELIARLPGLSGRRGAPSRGGLLFPPPEGDSLWGAQDAVASFWQERGEGAEPGFSRTVNVTLGLAKYLQTRGDGGYSQLPDGPLRLASKLHALTGILLCSPVDVANMAKKVPEVLELDPRFVLGQMVTLKALLPGTDIARMLELRPSVLLEEELGPQLEPQLALLRHYLPGVAVEEMVQEYPYILFEEIESGLKQFRELWPDEIVDGDALAGSTHHELVLAVRALSEKGAPRRWAAGGME